MYQVHCTATSVNRENIAILYDELETITIGINVFWLDVTCNNQHSISSSLAKFEGISYPDCPEGGELQDDTVKRDMTELNKLRVFGSRALARIPKGKKR
jgi:hypothetical protein